MPSFLNSLRGLTDAGHKIDCVVASRTIPAELRIEADWLHNISFRFVRWNFRSFHGLLSVLRILRGVYGALKTEQYDFVYGHGSVGALGCIVARLMGVPCGQRLYGVNNLWTRLKRFGNVKTAMASPLVYLAYRNRQSFLLVTDDGSHGDRVWERWGHRKSGPFYFWRNGVDFPDARLDLNLNTDEKCFLFMPARITSWKRQHCALMILRDLHALGWTHVRLCIAGGVVDKAYWEACRNRILDYDLQGSVDYLGALPNSSLSVYYNNCLAVLAPYALASMGNVVIEGLAAGAVVVVQDSDVLDGVIEDNVSGLRIKNTSDAAKRLAALLDDHTRVQEMRIRAAAAARRSFVPWADRVNREVRLIEGTARRTALWQEGTTATGRV